MAPDSQFQTPPAADSINSRVVRGASLMVLLKLVDRGIGLVSTIVLARLLVPADFGLIALAGSLIAMLEVLGAVGLDTALIQRSDARREHFDAAWTFHILFGLTTAVIVAGITWPLAVYYQEPRLAWVMPMIAIAHAIQAFENIGVVAFRKELEFDREFKYRVIRRVVTTFIVTIPLALILESYWALLIGSLAGSCITVALSYALHPFRPRLSVVGLAQLMTVSKWFLLTSIVEFLYGRMATLIIGRSNGPGAVGTFSLAVDIASLATQDISAPIHRAVFPGYAKLAYDRTKLRLGYLRVTSVMLLFVLPSGIGISLLAEPIVFILLGAKWMEAVPLLRILAIDAVLVVLLTTSHYVNLAVGMTRSTSLVLSLHAAMTIPMMLWSVPKYGPEGAAVSMLISSIIVAPLNLILLRRAISFGWGEMRHVLSRPLLGVLAMAGAILSLQSQWTVPGTLIGHLAHAFAGTLLGGSVYSVTVLLLWRWQGNADSAESWIVARVAVLAGTARARLGFP
ncbi:MAG: lipopolysaccharide biosynthesis protein [Burkholderiales bacterium]